MGIVEKSEFKGNAMIVLKKDAESRYPFQFGIGKAKLLVEHIEDIKAFIAEEEGKQPKED